MQTHIKLLTVEDLHRMTTFLMERGLKGLPVVATDKRAFYPLQAYTVLDQAGYNEAFLLAPCTHARFSNDLDPSNASVTMARVEHWNRIADEIESRCGAFA